MTPFLRVLSASGLGVRVVGSGGFGPKLSDEEKELGKKGKHFVYSITKARASRGMGKAIISWLRNGTALGQG